MTADGRIMHALSLIYILRDLEGIEQFKIIQRSKELMEIQIVRNQKFNGETAIKEKIKKVMGNSVTIDLNYIDFIKPEKSGKFKHVVSEIIPDYIK